MLERIDNFLPNEIFHRVESILMGSDSMDMPYFYRDGLSSPNDNGFSFGNTIWQTDSGQCDSHLFNALCIPIISRLSMKELIRIKVNCYTRQTEQIQSEYHQDFMYPHRVGIYCINTCDGYTQFKNGDTAPSIANTLYLFDGYDLHASVNQTDSNLRVNLNIYYI